jgi:glycosyltransferase involved in cell wall biosynthesis
MKPFTLHLLGLVHLPSSMEYLSCAFTWKNLKLAKMLTSLGHRVYFYGAHPKEKKYDVETYVDSDNLIFVETHTVEDIGRDYGSGDNRYEVLYPWPETDFRHDFDADRKPSTLQYYGRAIEHINKVKKNDDFLLNTMGYYFKPVADATGLFLNLESGIGYRGSYSAPNHFRCFESDYIRNFSVGSENPGQDINGNFYDVTIGNYFDPNDFEYSAEKEDYYLYIGRMISRKGVEVATKASNILGAKLIIAGQGAHVDERGHLISDDFDIEAGTWTYVGFANAEKRKRLMSKAIATYVPTLYNEPFGGVSIESRLSGTPVLTTDFGVFPGTTENGLDGFRCSTLDDFCWGAKNCGKLDHALIRRRAEKYLMDNIKWDYQKWLEDLYHLYLSAYVPGEPGWGYVSKEEPEFRKNLFYNKT